MSDGHAGFDPAKPSRLYVLSHDVYEAWKFGITNIGTTHDRIARFEYHGWQPVRLIEYDTGEDARQAENRVKVWAKSQGFLPAVDASDMPSSGHTETLRYSDVDDPDTIVAVSATGD